jgi:hypothetical protein
MQINAVQMHWNHVTNMGAGMDAFSLESNTLLRYTMEMDTHQYAATILKICREPDLGFSSPRSMMR